MTDQNPPFPSPGDPGAGPAYPTPQPGETQPAGYPTQFPAGQPTYGNPYSYGSPYQQPIQLPPSTAMSTWALVLAVFGFFPISLAAAIGLAITVLVRCREGRNHGKKRAIAALVIAGLYVVAFVVLVVLSVLGVVNLDEPARDASGHVTESKSVAIDTLRVGDCFDDASTLKATEETQVNVAEVTVKPCTALHDFELYAVFDATGDTYPGEEALQKQANDRCFDFVEAYSGHKGKVLTASVFYFYPGKLQWNVGHVRSIQCMYAFDSGPTRGSLRKD